MCIVAFVLERLTAHASDTLLMTNPHIGALLTSGLSTSASVH